MLFIIRCMTFVSARFYIWELAYALLDLDSWKTCGAISKAAEDLMMYYVLVINSLRVTPILYNTFPIIGDCELKADLCVLMAMYVM